MTTENRALVQATTPVTWQPSTSASIETTQKVVCNFLDTATTLFGRATHYNTREEQQKAEIQVHDSLFECDRDLYTLFLMLPGVTDHARQLGTRKLLSHPRNGLVSLLDEDQERRVLYHLVQTMPPQRMLKLFQTFPVKGLDIKRVNNARSRKIILRSVLGSSKLEFWAVKYRRKLRLVLAHAWGTKATSILTKVLTKDTGKWTAKEAGLVYHCVDRYSATSVDKPKLYECVSFILGNAPTADLPLLKAYEAAKQNLAEGKKLPLETLYGIRSVFHTGLAKEEVLKIGKDSLTTEQKLATQKRAKEAGVEVEIDPTQYDPIRLYLYAFEMGMTEEIEKALADKAQKHAQTFPVQYDRVGILVDASRSHVGDKTQKLRPMATVLALRDMLQRTGKSQITVYCGGEFGQSDSLVRPSGDTSLSEKLVDMLGNENTPEAIFVLSDGYENRPAGRFAEVVDQLREIGIKTPIYHINPVFAAEVGGTKELSPSVPTLPVQKPNALGISFLRGLLETDPVKGINALIQLARLPAKGGT